MSESLADSFPYPERVARPPCSCAIQDVEGMFRLRRMEVIRFLTTLGVDLGQAEDITQEVFLRALEPRRTSKPIENLFAWLLTCARNVAFNQRRRSVREIVAAPELWQHWETSLPDGRPGQEIELLKKERLRRLLAAVASLTAQEQQCLVLRGRGLTFREVAHILDMPLRTVANVASGAIRKVKVQLQDPAP